MNQSLVEHFHEQEVDPDPFVIGIGIFSCIAGVGAFLEARRMRLLNAVGQDERFRRRWYASTRTLIHFSRVVDEFETYVREDGFGRKSFRMGAVRLVVDSERKQAMKLLNGQTLTVAGQLANDLDDLSGHLGPESHGSVMALIDSLSEIQFPASYRDVIEAARRAIRLYQGLLHEIGTREGFVTEDDEKGA